MASIKEILKSVGSQRRIAEYLGVSQQAVSYWIRRNYPIPARHLKKLIQLSEGRLKLSDLRPDLFDVS